MKRTSLLLVFLIILYSNTVFAASDKIAASVSQNETVSQATEYANQATHKFLHKDITGAITDFDKAICINPNNSDYYLNRGYLKHITNDFTGALDDYNSALKINKNYAFAYNNRAVLKVNLNDINGAFDDYSTALQINPKYADVYYNRANLKYMLNDNKGALDDYNKAIAINPKDAEAFNNRGVVKKRMNLNEGALSDYSHAIFINPNDSIALANRGRLKKLYFDNEGAAIDLNQAVALAEHQVFIKNVKPLLDNNTHIAAIPIIQGVTETFTPVNSNNKFKNTETKFLAQNERLQPTPDNNIVQSASLKTQQKHTEISSPLPNNTIAAGVATVKAATAPNISTKTVTQKPTTNIKLAESYYIRGLQKCVLRDLQGAIADLNKAIENNTQYADAYFYRAAIKKELGDTEGFRKDYAFAIQINPTLQTFNDSNAIALING